MCLARSQSRDAMRMKSITPMKEGQLKHKAPISTIPATPLESAMNVASPGTGRLRARKTRQYYVSSLDLGGNHNHTPLTSEQPIAASNNNNNNNN